MAETNISVTQDQFSCSICLEILKDPVTTSCGHSFCMVCINNCWDQEDDKRTYSCPQCRQTFTSRPVVSKSIILAEVVGNLKKRESQVPLPGPEDVECDSCTGRKYKAVKSCLVCLASFCETHLQPHYESPAFKKHKLVKASRRLQEQICSQHDKLLEVYCRTDQQCICMLCTMDEHKGHDTISAAGERTEKQQLLEIQRKFQKEIQNREKKLNELINAVESHKCSAQTAVENIERICTELINSIRKRYSEVKELIRDREKAEVSQAERVLKQLEQEIEDLKKKDAELEQLSHTEDPIHFLQSFQSLLTPAGSAESPAITISPFLSFDDVTESVSQLREKVEEFWEEQFEKIPNEGAVDAAPARIQELEHKFFTGNNRKIQFFLWVELLGKVPVQQKHKTAAKGEFVRSVMAFSSSFLSEDQLQCSICLDVFTDPVSTSCGHNFCMICLKKCWDTSSVCQCPVCKKDFSKRPELNVNTFISGLAAEFKKSVQVKSSSAAEQLPSKPKSVLCDYCTEEKLEAVKSCLDCGVSYCNTHLMPHRTVAKLKKHKLIDPVKNLEDYICQKHEKPLEMFCRDDQAYVCLFCTLDDHKNHRTVSLEEEIEVKKNQLGEIRAELQQMIQERLNTIEEIQKSVELHKKNTEKEKAASMMMFRSLMSCIERNQAELIKVMEEKQKAAKKQAEEFIKDLRLEISELKRKNTELEHISNIDNHLHLLQICSSLCSPPPTKNWTDTKINPHLNVETLRRALSQLQKSLDTEMNNLPEIMDVTLDPDTANSYLILSNDGKQVRDGDKQQNLPDNPERFDRCVCVLGKQGFSLGRFYYEVQAPQKVGVFVDYEEGLVSFYDVDARSHIYTFIVQSFTEKLYPYFRPSLNYGVLLKMAEVKNSVTQDQFCCPVCLETLKDPAAIPCGHSFCMVCINNCWDQEDDKGSYSCPQCRQTFAPRPAVSKNIILAEVVENLRKRKFQVPLPVGPEDVGCDSCTGRKFKACWRILTVKSCLVCLASYCETHLQPHYESPAFKKHKLVKASRRLQDQICSQHDKLLEVYCRTDQQCICMLCIMDDHKGHDTISAAAERTEKQKQLLKIQKKIQKKIQNREKKLYELMNAVESHKSSAQTAVENIERICTELINSINRRCSEVKELIRDREKAVVSHVEKVLKQLEEEIVDLKKKDAELEELSHTEDPIHFLQSFQSLSAPARSAESPAITISSFLSFDEVTKSVSQLREKVEEFLEEQFKKIPDEVKEVQILPPQTREDFLQYFCWFTLDPNTVNERLSPSEENKVATCGTSEQSYPDHPDRFDHYSQVLCRESVSGRCYWEVEWSGNDGVYIAVAYKSISRKGRGYECVFGYNDQSWRLLRSPSRFLFLHNNKTTEIPIMPSSSRIGVYVDYRAGTLSYYSVSDTMKLFHRVQTTFTQPLYPGFWVCPGSTVKLSDSTN
ncbi:uncharacterized protein LOC134312002 [Trichomycterus rosablanca]|uniref:uncharacterized protein LOC134312002 n=1 Tax=Trichomycterus rosablanca TaxID=2290929 RepID=UPI002F34FF4A